MDARSTEKMDLEKRVARLERSSRGWRAIAIGSLVTLMLGGAMAMRPADPDELTVRKLVIVDATGRQRIVLSGSGMILADESEHPRIVMATLDNGAAAVQHFDADGRRRIATGTFPDGGASTLLLDTDRRVRLESGTYENGEARLAQFDPAGLPRLTAVTDGKGHATIEQSDSEGMPRISFGTSVTGLAEVRLADQSGVDRLIDRVEADGRVSRQLLRDPDRESPLVATPAGDGQPRG
jgi:hypothetical protein